MPASNANVCAKTDLAEKRVAFVFANAFSAEPPNVFFLHESPKYVSSWPPCSTVSPKKHLRNSHTVRQSSWTHPSSYWVFFYRVSFLFISLGQLPVSRFVIGASIPGAASGFDLKGLDFLKQNFYLILFRCFFFVDVVERNDERSGKRLRKASAGAVSAAKRPFYANDVAIYDDAIPIDSAPSFAFLSLILSFSHSLFLYLSFVVVVVVADVVGAGVTEFE